MIARHVGPDPDALGSQLGLKDIIMEHFPNKKVYAIGAPTARFKSMGKLDKINDEICSKSLLIALDTPDKKRVDGAKTENFLYTMKIDHHPFIEKYCDFELVDDKSSSTCELLINLCNDTKLEVPKEAASKIFMGIVADTNRFLFINGKSQTLKLVGELVEQHDLNITELYHRLYIRPLNEVNLQGYISQNLEVTDNGLAYIKLDKDIINKYKADAASAGNMVNEFNYINGINVWIAFSEDVKNNNIRATIRSRGPAINDVAVKYNGGGHKLASGARLLDWEMVDLLIKDYDNLCKEYNKKKAK